MASARTRFNAVQVLEALEVVGDLKAKAVAATATSGAATGNAHIVKVTSENLSTAAGGTYTLTLTNSLVTPESLVFANAYLGTSTQGTPQVVGANPGSGQVVVSVKNIHATQAFNGNIKIDVLVVNPV